MQPSPILAARGARPFVVGHRGAPGSVGIPASRETRRAATEEEAARYAPENTMRSFERALELGADLVEFDVHLSADGQAVVIHDETVDRTTDGSGPVAGFSLEELKRLDAGAWFGPEFAGQRIPSLEEVLEWAAGRTRVDIELKHAVQGRPGLEEAVVRALERHGMVDQAIVISFEHPMVARVKQLNPSVVTGILYVCRPMDCVGFARQAGADALLPHWSFVSPHEVAAAHDAGLAMAPWVTSEPPILRALVAAGVDGIGTNHPDRLRDIVAVG